MELTKAESSVPAPSMEPRLVDAGDLGGEANLNIYLGGSFKYVSNMFISIPNLGKIPILTI